MFFGTPSLSLDLYPKWNDGKAYWRIGQFEFGVANPDDSSGLYLLNRTAANASAPYRNDVELQTTTGASSVHDNQTIAACIGPHQGAAFGLGGALIGSQRTAVYERLFAYLQGVGAVE
jgi:hypothetical protein